MEPNLKLFAVQFALFVLLYFVLNKLLWQPLLKLLAERERHMSGALHEADSLKENARLDAERLEQRLGEARNKAAAERGRLRQETLAAEQKILSHAQFEVEAILGQARAELAEASEGARSLLRTEATALSDQIASNITSQAN
jgi:F-type H+-transporting ATPase subunit b